MDIKQTVLSHCLDRTVKLLEKKLILFINFIYLFNYRVFVCLNTRKLVVKKNPVFSAWASTLNMGLINKG